MSNKTHVTFGTCQKVASLEALIKWQQSLCSDVCAVVHERFTPCLLQNKVVSCSMRLNIFIFIYLFIYLWRPTYTYKLDYKWIYVRLG